MQKRNSLCKAFWVVQQVMRVSRISWSLDELGTSLPEGLLSIVSPEDVLLIELAIRNKTLGSKCLFCCKIGRKWWRWKSTTASVDQQVPYMDKRLRHCLRKTLPPLKYCTRCRSYQTWKIAKHSLGWHNAPVSFQPVSSWSGKPSSSPQRPRSSRYPLASITLRNHLESSLSDLKMTSSIRNPVIEEQTTLITSSPWQTDRNNFAKKLKYCATTGHGTECSNTYGRAWT